MVSDARLFELIDRTEVPPHRDAYGLSNYENKTE